MTRRRLAAAAAVVLAAILGLIVRNQLKVSDGRQARAMQMQLRHPAVPQPLDVARQRRALFELLQPVVLGNCRLERFGEAHDGGYLMCGNLLDDVESGYSYGINGYDGWGCDISRQAGVPVHQYDCFNTDRPFCAGGDTVFHAECVGGAAANEGGRPFDTAHSQLARNGDAAERIVLKMDVEGAEWDSLSAMPDQTLARIDQLAVEFHWAEDEQFRWRGEEQYLRLVRRLRQFFEVVHLHVNNTSCVGDLAPFPGWAYEVLFVSKRLAVVDRSRAWSGPHPLDARNNPSLPDCQPD